MTTDTAHVAELARQALAAIDAEQNASDLEDERFARWMGGDLHANSVRAAERRHNAAHLDRVDAVTDLERALEPELADKIAFAHHAGCDLEELRQAIRDAADEIAKST